MSDHIKPTAELHPRLVIRVHPGLVAERKRIARRYAPTARERFPALRDRLLASRPVLEIIDEGKPSQRVVFGAPTFRNVIEDGAHR